MDILLPFEPRFWNLGQIKMDFAHGLHKMNMVSLSEQVLVVLDARTAFLGPPVLPPLATLHLASAAITITPVIFRIQGPHAFLEEEM